MAGQDTDDRRPFDVLLSLTVWLSCFNKKPKSRSQHRVQVAQVADLDIAKLDGPNEGGVFFPAAI